MDEASGAADEQVITAQRGFTAASSASSIFSFSPWCGSLTTSQCAGEEARNSEIRAVSASPMKSSRVSPYATVTISEALLLSSRS